MIWLGTEREFLDFKKNSPLIVMHSLLLQSTLPEKYLKICQNDERHDFTLWLMKINKLKKIKRSKINIQK